MWSSSSSSSSRLFHIATPKIGRILLHSDRQQQFHVRYPSRRGRLRGVSTSGSSPNPPSPRPPAPTDQGSTRTTENHQNYVTGTVKNYMRKKSFGFVMPDGADTDQQAIFVHRSGIKSTALLPHNVGTANPFLIRNERVRFIIVHDDKETAAASNKAMAVQVEYEDGTPIPIYRSAYVENVKKYQLNVLGEAVYKMLGEEPDEMIRRIKIKELYEQTKQDIATGQTRYDDATGKLRRAGEEALRRTTTPAAL